MDYVISLDRFSGPLDLLLHLVKQSDIDICDIEIEKITKQYLNYIHKSLELELNIASEYLVMAAELIEMKSKILLPIQNDESEEIEDLKQNLIDRLTEYENYKNITPVLREFEESRREYFTKNPSFIENSNVTIEEDKVSIDELVLAFQKFLNKKELDKPLETKITKKEYSISKRCNEIKDVIKKKGKVAFTELFDVFEKDYVIITFLSILNLVKTKELAIWQDNNFENIFISNGEVNL